jgi:hypothetical protein
MTSTARLRGATWQDTAFIPGELDMAPRLLGRGEAAWPRRSRGDPILAYMHLMLAKARARNVELTEESWRRRGANLPLFPASRIGSNARCAGRGAGARPRHFIISSGNRELIEGSPIARHFEKIYARPSCSTTRATRSARRLRSTTPPRPSPLPHQQMDAGGMDEVAINKVLAKDDRPVPSTASPSSATG